MITIKSDREIELMRKAGKLASQCLREMGKLVVEGAKPSDLDRACREWTRAHGAIPGPLNYKGFPASLCVSINDVVCHGIPDDRPFKKGDIVNLVPDSVRQFVSTAWQAMWAGIGQVKPGNTVGDIGFAIENLVRRRGYSVVLEYCGHGIGRNFHEDPVIIHVGRPKAGVVLREGMTFTIEPMINMGAPQTKLDADGWTARTADGSLSAQFEHTVLVTPNGVEVLTLGEGERPPTV
jgi:methionyl aminopeptidase